MISNQSIHKYMENVFRILRAAYTVASLQIMEEEWTFVCCSDVPQQRNTYDCGVHSDVIEVVNRITSQSVTCYHKISLLTIYIHETPPHIRNQYTEIRNKY